MCKKHKRSQNLHSKKPKMAFQHLLGFFFLGQWRNIWCNFSFFLSWFPATSFFWVISHLPGFTFLSTSVEQLQIFSPRVRTWCPWEIGPTPPHLSSGSVPIRSFVSCWDSLNPGRVTVKYAGYFYCCCFLYVIQCEYLRGAPYKSVFTVITTISCTVLMRLNCRRRLLSVRGWTRSKRRQLSSFSSAKIKTTSSTSWFGWIEHLHHCDWINVLKLSNIISQSTHL